MPKSFLEFVSLLTTLGPKIKLVWPKILLVYTTVVAIVEEFAPATSGGVAALSLDENEAVAKLQSLLANEGATTAQAIASGELLGMLQNFWAFLAKNERLLRLVVSLITAAA